MKKNFGLVIGILVAAVGLSACSSGEDEALKEEPNVAVEEKKNYLDDAKFAKDIRNILNQKDGKGMEAINAAAEGASKALNKEDYEIAYVFANQGIEIADGLQYDLDTYSTTVSEDLTKEQEEILETFSMAFYDFSEMMTATSDFLETYDDSYIEEVLYYTEEYKANFDAGSILLGTLEKKF